MGGGLWSLMWQWHHFPQADFQYVKDVFMKMNLILVISLLFIFTGCLSTQKNTASSTTSVEQLNQTYQAVKSNVARLHAMINGKYVQYNNRNQGDDPPDYRVWLVNDQQDSVMLYVFPAGDPNKTSLPDEPAGIRFQHFQAINRDTIVLTYYDIPEDFGPTLAELLADPEKASEGVDFDKLQLQQANRPVYTRNNPLSFTSELKTKATGQHAEDWNTMYYSTTVEPTKIYFQASRSNDATTETRSSVFIKLDLLRSKHTSY